MIFGQGRGCVSYPSRPFEAMLDTLDTTEELMPEVLCVLDNSAATQNGCTQHPFVTWETTG